MIQVDLITGFLGAGKTTFIRGYIEYLRNQGEKIHIIENEFGKVSVDSELLSNIEDNDCHISDLAGMCMCCIGKSAFINMLIESSGADIDRIIVEPSGVYDVDEFFDVMTDPRVSSCCEIGTIITIVDPFSRPVMTSEAEYLMFSQLVASGTVIFSKTQMLEDDGIQSAMDWVEQVAISKGCENGLAAEYCTKHWDEFTDSDYEDFMDAGYYRVVHDREVFEHAGVFQSEELELVAKDKEELERRVKMFFNHSEYGRVFRVKGYVDTINDGCYEVNCTGDYIYLALVENHDNTNKSNSVNDKDSINKIDNINKKGNIANILVIIGQHLKYSMFHPTLKIMDLK